MNKELFRKLALALLFLYCLGLVVKISADDDNQWDFWIYYNSARAHAAGLNPYDAQSLPQVAQSPIHHSFAYPPLTLFLFRPFAQLDFSTAARLFLLIKCALLAGLLWLWRKRFLQQDKEPLFYFFCLLAFNAAIYIDMGAGNLSILEQLLLWLGFFFYLQRKLLLFCLFILAAAIFKLVPALFLFLLLFSKEPKRYHYLFGALACFLAMQLASYLAAPALFEEFVLGTNRRADLERDLMNPSTLAFLRDAFELLEAKMHVSASYNIQTGLFMAIVATLAIVTWRAHRALCSATAVYDEKVLIFLACLLYALVLPRFKDYSYILLIPPAYFILGRISYVKAAFFVMMTFVCTINPANGILALPGFDIIFTLFSRYYPLLMAYAIWAAYLYDIFILTPRPSPAPNRGFAIARNQQEKGAFSWQESARVAR